MTSANSDAEGEEQALTLDAICVQVRQAGFANAEERARPILPERGLVMLFAGRGIGKTHVRYR